MRATTPGVLASTFLAFLAFCFLASCAGPGPASGSDDMIGRVSVALTGVPDDGTCVQITAAGYRTVTSNLDASAGSSSVFELGGLPLGQVTFTSAAFAGACPPAPGAVPNWVSDAPFTTTVAIDPPVLVTLNLVRNGNANIVVGFDDTADGGTGTSGGGTSGGGATGGSTGGGGTGGATGSGATLLMQVAGVHGASTLKGFENWFNLEAMNFAASSPASAAGGAGASKTTWTATATLKFQQGLPELYSAATKGTRETVSFAAIKNGGVPFVTWKVALTGVLISGIVTNGSGSDQVPDLTITFVFTTIQLEFIGQNADGTAMPSTLVMFDIARGTGSAGPNPPVPLSFVINGQATPPAQVVSAFHAPSEMTAVTQVGAGGGVGKPTFSDASVTLPTNGSVLNMLAEEFSGRVTPTALVSIDAFSAAGMPIVFGSYGFTNVQIHGITLSDLTATVSFGASAFQWTQGAIMTTFP
jgi:type VI protein secretion system component Hcp